MASGHSVVRFIRGDKEISLPLNQVTVARLSTAFGIEEASLWLKEEISGRGFFPENGSFDSLSQYQGDIYRLCVEGRAMSTRQAVLQESDSRARSGPFRVITESAGMDMPVRPSQGPPAFRSVFSSRKGTHETITVKIKKATNGPNGKLTATEAAYCTLTDATASVPFVTTFIQQEFGASYVLVGNDGLEIRDQPGTRGRDRPHAGLRYSYYSSASIGIVDL